MFSIMSAFAQLERDQLAERTGAGMAAAAEHGRKSWRREATASHANVKRARALKAQGLTPADIGKIIGVSRATVYRYLRLESNERLLPGPPHMFLWSGRATHTATNCGCASHARSRDGSTATTSYLPANIHAAAVRTLLLNCGI
jgi:hypothetical protein